MCFTVVPTVNQTMSIPLFAETINRDASNTINAYNTTINATRDGLLNGRVRSDT